MVIIGYVSVVFMIVGALMFALCVNPKLARIGEMLFLAGAIAFAFGVNGLGLELKAR